MDINVTAGAASATAGAVPHATTGTATSKVAAAEPVAKAKPARAEVEKAVKSIQDFADSSQRNLKFSIDEKSHQVVVKVIATQTGMVVRQIPDEAAVKLAQSLSETGSLIFDEKV